MFFPRISTVSAVPRPSSFVAVCLSVCDHVCLLQDGNITIALICRCCSRFRTFGIRGRGGCISGKGMSLDCTRKASCSTPLRTGLPRSLPSMFSLLSSSFWLRKRRCRPVISCSGGWFCHYGWLLVLYTGANRGEEEEGCHWRLGTFVIVCRCVASVDEKKVFTSPRAGSFFFKSFT